MAQELLIQFSGGSRSVAKEMRALKMRSIVASHYKLTRTTWEHHQSWLFYKYTRRCWRTQRQPFYRCTAFEAKGKGEKAWQVGASCCRSVAQLCLTLCNPMDCIMPGLPVLYHLLELKLKSIKLVMPLRASWADHRSKILSLWSVIFSYSTQQKQTISWSDCDMWWNVDFIQQLVTTSSVVGPSRNFKALPKVKHAPKKGHGHCLVVCYQSDPLWLSESQQNRYIWEVCSANWWAALKTAKPTASFNQQKGPSSSLQQRPTARHTTNATEVEGIGLWSFASSTVFTCSLANW